MLNKPTLLILYSVITFISIGNVVPQFRPQFLHGCDRRSCYPATGNLLIGRGDKMNASDTCGLNKTEKYCIISSIDSQTYRGRGGSVSEKCYNCDASDENLSHAVQNIIHRWDPPGVPRRQQKMTWWQASNGRENVSVQLDLEAEFHVTHIIITFKTFRPAAMYIEKSFDWGKTWKIYRYFAQDCAKDFPGVSVGVPKSLSEVVCQSRYSSLAPSTQGEVIYRVLPPNIKFNSPGFNPYSKEVQDLLKTTNLRVTFTKLHTLGDEKLQGDQNLQDVNAINIREKYYFSIYDMVVRGSCSCYGHAESCIPEKEEHKDILGMVHGKCKCDHNTEGNNCERCKDFYQDVPWRPATGKMKNECKKCNCNNHTDKCHYDSRVFAASGQTSGGVCEDCQHNTEGKNCDMCIAGYYQDPDKQMTDPDACKECDCMAEGTVDDGMCDERTSEEAETVAGQCHCKTFVSGPRCDHCTPGYWNFTVENPDGCQLCTCSPLGTVDSGGGCNEQTGECQCKANVARVRDCDQCLPEHYGLSESDPLGCKACDCDPGGAYNNQCDVVTGQCLCRPNVKGRRCDQVEDYFYTGPLDYLIFEGEISYGSEIPPTQVIKRKPSDTPGQTTWTGFGFMQVFEGSTLTFRVPEIYRSMNYFPIIRYEHDPSHPMDWQSVDVELTRTDGEPGAKCAGSEDQQNVRLAGGTGSVQLEKPFCLEQSQRYEIKLTFTQYDPSQPQGAKILIDAMALLPDLDDIPFLNPQYESRMFEDGLGEVIDPLEDDGSGSGGLINLGLAGGSGEEDEYPDETSVAPPRQADPMDGWFPGREVAQMERELFENLGCRQHFMIAKKARTDPMPKDCERLLYSISFLTFQGAWERPCTCDNTGSTSVLCDKYYGGCECKTLVVGRQCDTCAPAAFGFRGSGCQPCDCHHLGSQNEFCDADTGQCLCNTQQPTFGRRCSECKPGFWSFPNCRQCVCNGHADTCHPETGVCINCGDNTMGDFCEECQIGYYGAPEFGENQVPCRECMCPDTRASGHSYAETCYLDQEEGQPVCHCEDGYAGDRCEICADNFFGHPELPGGECNPCDCSNNWDSQAEGNCDRLTGKCLKCLFFTEGDRCERCQEGYFGDAVNSQCSECTCDILGTDPERAACDRETGKCNCLPNVVGDFCSECAENHWKIASGEGCELCACDPVGSTSEECNLFTGQCDCRPGFGGRQCDLCEANYWGDPRVECKPCNCNPMGVNPEKTQCNPTTGQCECLEGIGGDKCDECAVGHIQTYQAIGPHHEVHTRYIPSNETPTCTPCGECFDNWERILQDLKENTTLRVEEAEKVKITGAAGAYTAAFENMESQIAEVNQIIDRSSLKDEELIEFRDQITSIEKGLEDTVGRMRSLDNSLTSTEQAIHQGQYSLTTLRQDADKLHSQAADIKDKATQLQEANVGGALTLTQQAKAKSDEAARKVAAITEETDGAKLFESAKTRGATQRLIKDMKKNIDDSQAENTGDLNSVTAEITRLEDRIPGLNKAVCDGETSREEPCDDLCGGAGCGKCGDVSCGEGALTKSQDALKDAQDAEALLREKDLEAEEALNKINTVHNSVQRAAELADEAKRAAEDAQTRSQGESDQIDELTKKIEKFLTDNSATPEEVKEVASDCLAAEMTMDAAEIQELADQINVATASVTDVDKINQETAGPLGTAEELKARADQAREDAEAQLARAENVTRSLGEAEEAQNDAEEAIRSALADIASAREDLGFIQSEMEAATAVSDQTFGDTNNLLEEQRQLQTAFISNENHVKKAQAAAEGAKSQASKANADLYKLNSDFKNVSESLSSKEANIGTAKDRALILQRRASTLSNSASQKLSDLLDMEKQYEENQRELEELSETLQTMNCQMLIHLKTIQAKSNFYTTCQPPRVFEAVEECECKGGMTEPVCSTLQLPARY